MWTGGGELGGMLMFGEAQSWGLGAKAEQTEASGWDEGQTLAVVVAIFLRATADKASPHAHSRGRRPGQELWPQRAYSL